MQSRPPDWDQNCVVLVSSDLFSAFATANTAVFVRSALFSAANPGSSKTESFGFVERFHRPNPLPVAHPTASNHGWEIVTWIKNLIC